MGGWKGPGQHRGRVGPEKRRRAAERGGGGGNPAPLSPAREPSLPSCLLLPLPRGAAMTVSAPRGQPLLAPGRGESDGPSPAAPLLGSPLLISRRGEKVSAGRRGDSSGRAGRPASPSPSLLLTFPAQEPGRPRGRGNARSQAPPSSFLRGQSRLIQSGSLPPPLLSP